MWMDLFVICVTAVCGIVGVLSVIGALWWSREWIAIAFQRLFIICLVSLGGCTLLAVGYAHTSWILGAAVFGFLCIVATIDYSSLRHSRPAAAVRTVDLIDSWPT